MSLGELLCRRALAVYHARITWEVGHGQAHCGGGCLARGGAVTFQWLHNGWPVSNIGGYSGAFTSRLRINNINGSHEGDYEVIVTNDCGSVTSEPIDVDVIGSCVGDVVLTGTVDIADLIAVIDAWGACVPPTACLADLTHDNVVDVDDLIAVILSWGPCS